MTFRWYGPSDPVTIDKIGQIPVIDSIVSAVYDVPVGEVWSNESINALKTAAAGAGLTFEVVESVPVHEDIKMGKKNRDRLLDNYRENIYRLGKAGVKCVCYNFMPVFDWLRSELRAPQKDGSNALAYDEETVLKMNPSESNLSLPGWDESYTRDELVELLKSYENIGEKQLFDNLQYFLEAVIPAAEEAGVTMAIHPDDPPWGIFGLPRIITDIDHMKKFLSLYPSVNNGLTFCTGSFGAAESNDLIEMIKAAEGRIHFAHLRNIKFDGYRKFHETAHPTRSGSLDMAAIVKTLIDCGFDGYVRPDHGRMIWGETGRGGYGLYDRALGAMYLYGLFEGMGGIRDVK